MWAVRLHRADGQEQHGRRAGVEQGSLTLEDVKEALMQIAACYRRLGKPDEARGTLEQAKVMWARIRPDAPFTETTNYTRDEWKSVLNWYASL